MRQALVLVLAGTLFCVETGRAGFERTESGARSVCFGGAFVGLADDAWAVAFNPAGLARLRSAEFSAFYSPQPFGIPELRSLSFVGAYPTGIGSFAASVRTYGYEVYKEMSATVSYAADFQGIYAGANFSYHAVSIARYGSAGTLGIDLGLLTRIGSRVMVGIAAKNINAPEIGQANEPLPRVFTVGFSYQPLDGVSLAVDYRKEIGFAASPRVGFEYWIVEYVALRGGFADEPATYAAGGGLRYDLFQLDYGVTTHEELGITHQISFTLRWGSGDE